MKKQTTTLIMYSHSSYSDVWPIFFKQSELYLSKYKKVLFSDNDLGLKPPDWDFVSYDDNDNYAQRMASCLEKINTPLSFLHHEDMPLYKKPNYDLLDKYESIVLKEDIDFIRLLRSVDDLTFNYRAVRTLFPVPSHSQYFFAVQPTIFKTERLLEIYEKTEINSIRDFEINAQKVCRDNGIKGLFHYDEEPKSGLFHYDSNVYPYIATAIVKGKWNLSGYPKLLKEMLQEFKIESSIRGEI